VKTAEGTHALDHRTRQGGRAVDMLTGATYSQNRSDSSILRWLVRNGHAVCTSPKRFELTAQGRAAALACKAAMEAAKG
jgi:hypothetical protein